MADPTLLSEEELAVLEALCCSPHVKAADQLWLSVAQIRRFIAAARAVRGGLAEVAQLRAEYRLGPVTRKDGTDATPVDLPRHLLDRIEAALTGAKL